MTNHNPVWSFKRIKPYICNQPADFFSGTWWESSENPTWFVFPNWEPYCLKRCLPDWSLYMLGHRSVIKHSKSFCICSLSMLNVEPANMWLPPPEDELHTQRWRFLWAFAQNKSHLNFKQLCSAPFFFFFFFCYDCVTQRLHPDSDSYVICTNIFKPTRWKRWRWSRLLPAQSEHFLLPVPVSLWSVPRM